MSCMMAGDDCVSPLQVSVHLGNWQQVLNYYSKAEASPEMTDVRSTM